MNKKGPTVVGPVSFLIFRSLESRAPEDSLRRGDKKDPGATVAYVEYYLSTSVSQRKEYVGIGSRTVTLVQSPALRVVILIFAPTQPSATQVGAAFSLAQFGISLWQRATS